MVKRSFDELAKYYWSYGKEVQSGFKLNFNSVVAMLYINPSSPKGGVVPTPPNGYRPGAQNRTAKA